MSHKIDISDIKDMVKSLKEDCDMFPYSIANKFDKTDYLSYRKLDKLADFARELSNLVDKGYTMAKVVNYMDKLWDIPRFKPRKIRTLKPKNRWYGQIHNSFNELMEYCSDNGLDLRDVNRNTLFYRYYEEYTSLNGIHELLY